MASTTKKTAGAKSSGGGAKTSFQTAQKKEPEDIRKETIEEVPPVTEETVPKATISVPEPHPSSPSKKVEVSLNDIVYVQSCFHGNLFYQSKRNGSIVEWQQFGEEQPMDVDELMYMRNTQPTFFKEQWIRLVGDNADDVFEFLHLERYCKNNLKFDSFDDVFAMEPDEIETVVKSFSSSLRESFARRALELVEGGELENLRKIKAIERASGYSLLK